MADILGFPHGDRPGDTYPPTEVNPNESQPEIVKYQPPSHLFLSRLQAIADRNVQLAIRKNSDYANPDRPFANFEAAPLVGVSIPRGMLVRMQDKLQRISNLLDRPARISDETILETCDDLSNYALILRVWLEQNAGDLSDGNAGR
jgi:hypothetical protein